MTAWWIYAVGFLAQAFFSARILVQWILSERAREVVSPSAYWICSVAGSWLLFFYGWLRDDFRHHPRAVRLLLHLSLESQCQGFVAFPAASLPGRAVVDSRGRPGRHRAQCAALFPYVPAERRSAVRVVVVRFVRTVDFSLRFVYQWYCSVRLRRSVLPAGFWAMSLLGSGMIVLYGFVRHDPVLILGQSFGFVAYVRNLFIGKKHRS